MRGDLLWASIPEMATDAGARFGDAEAVVDGARRVTFTELVADFRRVTAALDGLGHRAGRARRDLGAEPLRVAGRRARHARRRCRGGAGEHAVQGQRGPPHPRPQWRTRRLHRGRVPRHGLRRDARRPSTSPPEPRPRRSDSTTYRASTTRSARSCGWASPSTTPRSTRASAPCKRTMCATCCSRRERRVRRRACR